MWEYFKYPIEVMVLVSFVSVMGLGVERLIAKPLPAELGGTSPFAHVVIMGAASMTGLHLLRRIRADLDGHAPQRGLLSRGADVALGLGMHAALGGAGSAAIGGAKGLRNMLGRGQTPWERLDEQSAAKPEDVLGAPQEGFAPVPNGANGSAGVVDPTPTSSGLGTGSAPGGPNAIPAAAAPAGPDLVTGPANRAAQTATRAARSAGPQRTQSSRGLARSTASSAQLTLGGHGDDSVSWAASEVEPLSDTRRGGVGVDTRSYNNHPDTDIPLPPEPVDDSTPPPPDDGGATATVDPITGH